ncbi:MAG: exodeoxyribonuclease VII small subunit [Saprospiraceae bacterium]
MKYEAAVKELQMIVNELESDAVDMDNLLEKVKRAKELLVLCKGKLRHIEEEIEL